MFLIVSVIAAMAVPALQSAIGAAKRARAVSDVRTIGNDALGYDAQYGAAPLSLLEIGYDKNVDPWGHPYQYLVLTPANMSQARTDRFGVAINTYFDVYSLGPDNATATQLTSAVSQDDIIWASDGVFIGIASNY